MGWNDLIRARTRALACAVAAAGFAALGGLAGAQGTGSGTGTGTTTSTATYSEITNNYLDLQIGTGTLNGGYVGLATTPKNPFDPFNDQQLGAGVFVDNMLVLSPPIATNIVSPYGSKIYLRVNGGFDKRLQNGWDYVIGTASNGTTGTVAYGTDVGYWIQPPVQIGNSLVARWATLPFTYGATDIAPPWLPSDISATGSNAGSTGTGNTGGTGGTGTGTGTGTTTTGAYYINNQIEVDMYATLVGETVRLQLNVVNQNTSTQTVGVFFAQNINVNPGPAGIETSDGPVRIPGSNNLVHETLLYGTQIPQYYETFDIAANTSATSPPHSIRGTLQPYATTESEPTAPTRLIYGRTDRVNIDDSDIPPAYITAIKQLVAGRWDFIPDPTIVLDLNGADASMGVVWDESPVAPNQTKSIVTYIGGSNSTSDFSPPMGLAVYSPTAIQYNGSTTGFQVTALLHNFTDVTNVNGTTYDVGPVTVSLQLPPGLITSSTPTQTLTTLGPGTDGTCTWQVSIDPNNTAAATGTLTYGVSATPKLGNGKVVQRSIIYPASHTFTVPEPQAGTPVPIMLSIPFSTGSSIPSTVIPGLANLPKGFQLTRYNPLNPNANSTNVVNQLAAYEPQNSFTPGYAYWFWIVPGPNAAAGTTQLAVASQFQPLANQVQPNAQTYGIVYPQGYYGWNQVGDPYIYPYQFANINVFDPDSGQVVDITTASSTSYGWISPAVYHFNVNSTNSNHLDLQDNFGFIMQPYDGYWIQVNKANLQFLYAGVDTPGAAVNLPLLASNRSLGVTLGKNETNNWRVNLQATGATTGDHTTYIGVAPNAVDGPDIYKYAKPPAISNVLGMSIQHTDWGKKNGLYAQDLRSATLTSKTWNLLVQSAKPNEEVHITWPGIAASVPRNVNLTLIDPVTNTHTNLRTATQYVINTGSGSSRSLQVVSQQTSGAGMTRIASLNVTGNAGGRAATVQSVSINYTLTQAADTQIVVRDSGGHAIRTITTSTTRADGALNGTALWDLKTDRGVAVSTGVYNIELNALGSDGQLTRQIRPFVLSR